MNTLCYTFGKYELFFNGLVVYLFVCLFMVPNRQWAYFTNQKILQKFYVCVTKNFEPMVVMGSTKSLSLDSGDQKNKKERESSHAS